jgi:hypothetical protein
VNHHHQKDEAEWNWKEREGDSRGMLRGIVCEIQTRPELKQFKFSQFQIYAIFKKN